MRKKLLSILLVLSLMLALVPAAFAADAVRTELESDGTTLAFYGSGVATADCWNGDWTAVTHVDLGYEIRGVAENVLARCVNLVSFEAIGSRYLRTYNGGLISIDGRQMLAAPNRCTAYEILDLVQTVKTGAFRYCQGLTAVTFPAPPPPRHLPRPPNDRQSGSAACNPSGICTVTPAASPALPAPASMPEGRTPNGRVQMPSLTSTAAPPQIPVNSDAFLMAGRYLYRFINQSYPSRSSFRASSLSPDRIIWPL